MQSFPHSKKNKSIFSLRLKKKLWFLLIAFVTISMLFYLFILKDLPFPTKLNSLDFAQSTQIFDRNKRLLYSIYSSRNQKFIPLSSIPKHVREATIAIEDKDFYSHGAIDFRAISRSLVSIIFRRELQGGSTLTQQLVKNSLLTPERTISRKIKEVILSFVTEAIYPKDKILEMYLNQVPYGGTAWGIEAAAQTYFGKSTSSLDLAESALLAGLPESPTTNSPYGAHPEFAKKRQTLILNKMYEQKYITVSQKEKALKQKLKFKPAYDNILAPHFVLYIKDLLVKKYGEKLVEEGGLNVITSLDYEIQDFAQKTVKKNIEELAGYHVTNGAALVTIPGTGEILAMVGSRDYFDDSIDGNVNVVLSLRQPGSSIKPVNYAVGLIKGYTAATPFIDAPVCFPTLDGKNYCPVNYDGNWHGVVQMRYALGNSINIPAVKMLKLNGIQSMISTASAMGITSFDDPDRYGLSLTLGGGEVTMLDMGESYAVFANQGYRINLHPILKITDSRGKVLEEYKPLSSPIFGKKVLPEGVAFIISDILADNNSRMMAFGSNSSLRIPDRTVSVKTGTTNDLRDNWTIGYTPSFVVAVWVGNNDNTPMGRLTSGVTGAAPIWNEIMTYLLKDKPIEPLPRPPNVIQKSICSISGLLPKSDGEKCETRFEYFLKGTEPKKQEEGLQKVRIDKTTQDLAKPNQTENIEEKEVVLINDAAGEPYCITCPHPTPTGEQNPTSAPN
ncbi:MAG: penicillin-binding protein [Candidatus Levybacteria bacterium]|nr:penicillin-binding protein [Candidatus Levybacteria bacterium]